MTITCKHKDEVTTLFLGDKFDFSEVDNFKSAYEDNPAENYILVQGLVACIPFHLLYFKCLNFKLKARLLRLILPRK